MKFCLYLPTWPHWKWSTPFNSRHREQRQSSKSITFPYTLFTLKYLFRYVRGQSGPCASFHGAAACQGHSQEAQIPEPGLRGQTEAVSSSPACLQPGFAALLRSPYPKPPPKVRLPNGAIQMSVQRKVEGHCIVSETLLLWLILLTVMLSSNNCTNLIFTSTLSLWPVWPWVSH